MFTLKDLINAAKAVYPEDKILSVVTVAQAILESGFSQGGSQLANRYNNLFGIKGEGTDGSISLLTHEYVGGNRTAVYADFAVNDSLSDSFRQHKDLLDHERYEPVRDANSVEEAFKQLQKCGYATDPNYPAELQDVRDQYDLDSYFND